MFRTFNVALVLLLLVASVVVDLLPTFGQKFLGSNVERTNHIGEVEGIELSYVEECANSRVTSASLSYNVGIEDFHDVRSTLLWN